MAKVYVMDDGELRKIGFSADPATRAKQVRRKNAVRVVFEIETQTHQLVERIVHLKLAERRIVGEWFDVSVDEAIEAVTFAIENPQEIPSYQDRLKQDGGGRFPTLTLSPDEMARWRDLEGRLGGADRGAAKRTLLACMAAAEGQGAPDVPGILRRLADQIEAGQGIKLARGVEVKG